MLYKLLVNTSCVRMPLVKQGVAWAGVDVAVAVQRDKDCYL
jgi:hypothetical protein